MVIKFNDNKLCFKSNDCSQESRQTQRAHLEGLKQHFWFNSIKLDSGHNNSSQQIQEVKEIRQTQTGMFKSVQPAETEVSHVNWILRRKTRFIPCRHATRPPAVAALTQQTQQENTKQYTAKDCTTFWTKLGLNWLNNKQSIIEQLKTSFYHRSEIIYMVWCKHFF